MKKSSTNPIPDKAEVSIDFPDKFYMGSFPRDAKFEARSEDDGLFIKLTKMGDNRRQVEIHLHYLLADILAEWAVSLATDPTMKEDHRERFLAALAQVEDTLR